MKDDTVKDLREISVKFYLDMVPLISGLLSFQLVNSLKAWVDLDIIFIVEALNIY